MSFHLLRILLFLASLLIILAGAAFYIAGPSPTLAIMLDGIRPLLPNLPPITNMGTANVDSELRFFAPFFVAYGVLVFLCAKHLRTHLYYVPHLLGIFFLGGVGRVLSYFTIGAPDEMFIFLMGIEVGLPILLYLLYKYVVAKLTKG